MPRTTFGFWRLPHSVRCLYNTGEECTVNSVIIYLFRNGWSIHELVRLMDVGSRRVRFGKKEEQIADNVCDQITC